MNILCNRPRISLTGIAWVVPLGFLINMTLYRCDIYIAALNLYIPSIVFFWITLTLTLSLTGIRPLHHLFAQSELLEILYYWLPVTVVLMLTFAQYHFAWCILLLLTSVLGAGLATRLLAQADHPRHRENPGKFCVAWLLALSALFLVPCAFTLHNYGIGAPNYRTELMLEILPSDTTDDLTQNAEALTRQDRISANQALIEQLQGECWEHMSLEKRLTVLQQIADIEAACLGIDAIYLECSKLNISTLGKYSPTENRIIIDLQHVNVDSSEACVKTIAHEMYHAFQYTLICSINWEDPATQNAYYDQARTWKENSQAYYTSGEDYEDYCNQPLEADARTYSEEAVKNYFEINNRGDLV